MDHFIQVGYRFYDVPLRETAPLDFNQGMPLASIPFFLNKWAPRPYSVTTISRGFTTRAGVNSNTATERSLLNTLRFLAEDYPRLMSPTSAGRRKGAKKVEPQHFSVPDSVPDSVPNVCQDASELTNCGAHQTGFSTESQFDDETTLLSPPGSPQPLNAKTALDSLDGDVDIITQGIGGDTETDITSQSLTRFAAGDAKIVSIEAKVSKRFKNRKNAKEKVRFAHSSVRHSTKSKTAGTSAARSSTHHCSSVFQSCSNERSCFSCGRLSTPCWRPSWHPELGQLCNSCGLRYRKTGVHCPSLECRYVPSKIDLAELKAQHRWSCPNCNLTLVTD